MDDLFPLLILAFVAVSWIVNAIKGKQPESPEKSKPGEEPSPDSSLPHPFREALEELRRSTQEAKEAGPAGEARESARPPSPPAEERPGRMIWEAQEDDVQRHLGRVEEKPVPAPPHRPYEEAPPTARPEIKRPPAPPMARPGTPPIPSPPPMRFEPVLPSTPPPRPLPKVKRPAVPYARPSAVPYARPHAKRPRRARTRPEKPPSEEVIFSELFQAPKDIKRGIIVREILGPPRAMRPYGTDNWME